MFSHLPYICLVIKLLLEFETDVILLSRQFALHGHEVEFAAAVRRRITDRLTGAKLYFLFAI
jgi:hypothetical protein